MDSEWYDEDYVDIEDDDDDIDATSYDSDEDNENGDEKLDIFTPLRPIKWKEVTLNGVELVISTEGKYKLKSAFGLFDSVYTGDPITRNTF